MPQSEQGHRLGVSGRVASYFQRSQLTPLLALLALLLGLFAVLVTPREEEPQINVTMANVFIPFPGAAVEEVQNRVTVPAEQVISRITGVEHVYSVTQPGMAVLTVQFKVGEDRTAALVRLHDTLMANSDWIPPYAGVGDFIVKPKGIDDVPIVTLTLHSARPEVSAYELRKIAQSIEIDLKRVVGTREVTTLGGPQQVVRVTLAPDRMAANHVTAADVARALTATNQSLPSGALVSGNRSVEVRTGQFLANAQDVGQLVVGTRGAGKDKRPVFLADVATVTSGPDQPNQYVWFGARNAQGVYEEAPAVTLAISKQAGENASSVADAVLTRVQQLKGQVIPDDTVVVVTRNYGETAAEKARQLITKLIFATLSVVLLVWAALGRREAAIVGMAVVLTLALTLFASWAWGFTLNRVSLFALIFSIGILVDDAIVVVENIHRRRGIDHLPLAQIIPRAVDEVGGPTVLATLTVIAALLPMAFVSGLMGPYMAPIPINSSMGMLISLAVAFSVTPWLALKLLKSHASGPSHVAPAPDRLSLKLSAFFTRAMTPFVTEPRGRANRWKLAGGIALAIVLSMALVPIKAVVLKMLPFDNKSEFQVVLDMPTGTPVESTAAVLHELAAELAAVPEVTNLQAYAGLSAPINFNGLVRQYYLRNQGEQGDLQVNLLAKGERHRKSHEIAAAVEPALTAIARKHGGDLKVVEVPPGPPVMSPIVAEIYGPDYAAQTRLAKQVRGVFEKTADITAIDDTVVDAARRVVLRVDPQKAALLGVSVADAARLAQLALGPADVTAIHDGVSKYTVPVRVGLADSAKGSLDALLNMRVRGQDAAGKSFEVALAELVVPVELAREQVIYRKNLQPVVYVFGDVAGGRGRTDSPLYGMFAMRGAIAELEAPAALPLTERWISPPGDRYSGFSLKWDGEWQVTYETFRDMGAAYGVGLILIYLLVVAQFRSYVTPLVIMAPIPLTIIGVLPGHALLGAQFTATSMIGMIALAGIIVRNSILLVDFINQELAAGVEFAQAVINAAAARAKPIVLTAVAAMLGAVFILDDPIFNGLAIALLFGIFVSTALTLIVIPVLYYAIHRHRVAALIGAQA